MSLEGQWRKHSIVGDTKFQSTRISFAFGSRNSAVGNGEHASTFNLSELWDRLQGADSNDKGTPCLAKLCDGIGKDRDAADMLPGV
ncbi:hypothetical protein F2Q69_00015177 [Brassica cretica]|uniref:Uncharacterized protein n=1 Tax=Brassica cretica TaxID=69181 RepID=A0A8S9R9U0_BRACR|nr:hypothetical protein F2Q69_00015177 [Brassica cretica]